MRLKRANLIALGFLCFPMALTAAWQAQAADADNPYPKMAPVEQYLMDQNAEIALARTAAPAAISGDATIMVLGRHGYETAVEGKNGFVCLVERGWNGAFTGDKGFWNPKSKGPDCYNPPAARSVMPIILMRAKFALAGQSMDQMYESIKAAVAKNELTTPEPGGMAYMLSKQQYLNDRVGNWHPHLMFFVPVKDKMTWGEADIPGSPLMVNTHFDGAPEPVTEFMVTVSHWSDGTPFSGSSIHAEAH